jgi:hypothetical protein
VLFLPLKEPFSHPVEQNLDHCRMPVERRSAANPHVLMHLGESLHHSWQIALQVNSQGQEIGNHQNVPDATTGQASHRFVQAGLCLQKCHLHIRKASRSRCRLRHRAYRLIGRLHTRPVCKDDNSALHRYHEHNKVMIKTILVALVGMGMGGMIGLLADVLGAGNLAILLGAALGGLVFSFAAPRIGRAA